MNDLQEKAVYMNVGDWQVHHARRRTERPGKGGGWASPVSLHHVFR